MENLRDVPPRAVNDLLSTPAPPWFLELYRRHFSSVYRSASLFGVEDDELEDAAQEVFFIAYRRQEEFDADPQAAVERSTDI